MFKPNGGTVTLGANNIDAAAPALADPLPGSLDVHQLSTSATINAGSAAAARDAGSAGDFEGEPRIIGPAPDIGADEIPLAPTVATAVPSVLNETTVTLTGTVNPNALATAARFQWGPTTAYGNVTADRQAGSGAASQSAAATLTGLAPGTMYHARLVAENAKGTVNGADVTFTTPSARADAIAPRIGNPALSRPKVRRGQGTVLRFSLSENATVRLRMDRLVTGRLVKGKCTAGARRGRRCSRVVAVTTKAKLLAGGSQAEFAVPIRVRARPLARGRYRLTVTAFDAAGNASSPRRITLTVR